MNIFKMPNKNTLININCRISDSARLPLSVTRGNVSERANLAQQYSDQLRQGLDKISEGKQCSVQKYKELITQILGGTKINLKISPIKNSKFQGTLRRDFYFQSKSHSFGNLTIEQTDANIIGYSMQLPLSKDNTTITNKYTALHEGRHLFDHICNPKTIPMRSCQYIYEDKKLDSFYKIYNGFTQDYRPYLTHSKFKKQIRDELKNISNEEAIDVLQASRQTISTEKNAYKDEMNYLIKRPISNINSYLACCDFLFAMSYDKKYKFANELLAEKLKSARETIHINNNNKKV